MKNYRGTLAVFLVSVLCFLAYNIKGSYVAADGLLVEPFYLSAIGSITLCLSAVLFILNTGYLLYKNIRVKE